MTAVFQTHFIIFVIDEMTTVLQIRVFRVKPVSKTNPTPLELNNPLLAPELAEKHNNYRTSTEGGAAGSSIGNYTAIN